MGWPVTPRTVFSTTERYIWPSARILTIGIPIPVFLANSGSRWMMFWLSTPAFSVR